MKKQTRGYWSDENIQRKALDRIGRKLGVKEQSDWYSVSANNVHRELSFIKMKYGSLFNALKTLYPEHNWEPLHFSRKPRGYWNDITAQRDALEKLGRESFGVKELDDWYSVNSESHELNLINKKYGSLFNALKKLYPENKWDPLRFSIKPRGHWSDENAQRDALERLGRERFGVKELDDWYSVSARRVHSELSFIHKEYGSLCNALKKCYPEHKWDPLRFSIAPRGYWTDESAQRNALERLGREKLGVKELDDWYSVPLDTVYKELVFINKEHGSLFNALKTFFPQHNWDPLRFPRVPRGVCKEAIEKLERKLGVKELDDWYFVNSMHSKELSVINKKYGSLFNALKTLYPQHQWDPIRLSARTPQLYWQQGNVVKQYHDMFIDWKKTHNIRTISDWYAIPPQQFGVFKRASMGIFGSIRKMLESWFPDIVWQSQFTSQIELQVSFAVLFMTHFE